MSSHKILILSSNILGDGSGIEWHDWIIEVAKISADA